jgi:hypothetical protein
MKRKPRQYGSKEDRALDALIVSAYRSTPDFGKVSESDEAVLTAKDRAALKRLRLTFRVIDGKMYVFRRPRKRGMHRG